MLSEADILAEDESADGVVSGGVVSGDASDDRVTDIRSPNLAYERSAKTRATSSTSDDAILPATYDAGALDAAIGTSRRRTLGGGGGGGDDDDWDDVPRKGGGNRRIIAIAALTIFVGVLGATMVLLGRVNAESYYVTCGTDHVAAERGRTFPPWGSRPMSGAQWKPVPLPPNAECKPREADSVSAIEGWFLELLLDRASTTLTAKNLLDTPPGGTPKGGANPLDVVSAQLNQALLLSRAPERRDQRKEIERLQGDVKYWRATLRLRDASAALADAARQFDEAATQRPRHVTDAGAWGTFLHRLVEEVKAGPNGAAVMPSEPGTAAAPLGTMLPVEPTGDGSASEPVVPVTPDAGVPTGGVLL